MRLRLLLASGLAVLTTVLAVAPASHAATSASTAVISAPVTGTCAITNSLGTFVGTFTGTFTVARFSSSDGTLLASGTLTGTCTAVDSAGNTITRTVNQTVTVPVVGAQATCRILRLEIGPIHLDLLGLRVDTNRIVLEITAQSGPGNLLGNLLCAIANALNAGAPSSALANLLNQVLAILR